MKNTTTSGIKIAFFSAHAYDIESMKAIAEQDGVAQENELVFFQNRLSVHSAPLAAGCEAVVIFVNDTA
ncbi:2-hydroxyacid dehydrogenase, partial [Globisporangium polare]